MQEINKKNARVWSMLGMRRVVGQIISDFAENDNDFVFMTADVARYFGTEKFEEQYADQIVDVGIAEQNLICVAAGMAKEGCNVFAATYSTFITARALDQVRVNLGYMRLPVKLIGVGAGFAEGDLGPTHMGLEDIANMRSIPDITILSPADGVELVKTMYALQQYEGPAYIRLTGRTNTPVIYKEDYDFKIGKAIVLREGKDIAVFGNGVILKNVLIAAELLEKEGISCKVINMHTIKPLDIDEIRANCDKKLFVSVEEHNITGGLGSAISEQISEWGINIPLVRMGFDGRYPRGNEYESLLPQYMLTPEKIRDSILKKMEIIK